MLTLDDLKTCAGECFPLTAPTQPVRILLDADEAVGPALDGLFTYFGEDDRREAVQLVIHGEPAGYLTRSALYNLADVQLKGIGSADHMMLPGLSAYTVLQFRCTVDGCRQYVMLTYCDAVHPPACPDHGLTMVRTAS